MPALLENGLSENPRQLRLPLGVVVLDRSLTITESKGYKAPRPSFLKSDWRCNKKAEISLVESIVIGIKQSPFFTGIRFHYDKHYSAMSIILANLLHADTGNRQLIFKRDTKNDNEIFIRCFDYLADQGLISMTVAAPMKEVSSWAVANDELISLLAIHEARIVFNGDINPVVIRDSRGKPKRVTHRADRLAVKRLSKFVDSYNRYWLDHSVTLKGSPVIPFLKRIFNKKLTLGGRFYGDYQRLPSKQRKHILIDGQKTVEVDYSSLHLAILYAMSCAKMEGDAYTIDGYERSVIKLLCLRLVNSENLAALKRVISSSANPKNGVTYKKYKDARAAFELARSKGLTGKEPRKPKWIDSYIPNMPPNVNANDLLEAFLIKHEPIRHLIGQKDIGLTLQRQDSELIASCMKQLYEMGIPVLPVHDSLICKRSDKPQVMLVMKGCFYSKYGQSIDVKLG